MAKTPRKKQITLAPMPPAWIDNDAQNAGCEIDQIQREGRAPLLRRTRTHLLERMAKPRQIRGRPAPALITRRQMDAGLAYFNAWCNTQKTPEQNGVFVDCTPDWDGITLMGVERIAQLAAFSKWISRENRWLVNQVCLMQVPIRHNRDYRTAKRFVCLLRSELDAMADGLMI